MTMTTTSPRRATKKWVFAATVVGAAMSVVSMAWACTFNMGDAYMSPSSSVPRNSTFKFWGQGLTGKTNYKLYFVDNLQMSAGLECHSTSTVFTTKYKQYNASGQVVTKPGMKTNSGGYLDSDFTLSGTQPYKAYMPSVYPEDSVAPGPHDYRPGIYPDPGAPVPSGRSTICGREVNVDGTLNDYSATKHLLFTVS